MNENGQTRLMEMCLEGDIKNVRNLIENGADIDAVNNNNENALMYALKNPTNIECVQFMADVTTNLLCCNKDEESPLIIAVKSKNLSYTSILLKECPHLLNFPDYMGNPPLYHAMMNKDKEMVKLLLKYGASINRRNVNDVTPLELIYEFPEMKSIMEPYIFTPKYDYEHPNWSEALIGACRNKEPLWANHWIKKGGNVNYKNNRGETPLYWAILKHDTMSVAFLIKDGVNIHNTIFSYSYLHLSMSMNNIDAYKMLVKCNIDINKTSVLIRMTPLMYAIELNRPYFIQDLISRKADINRQNKYGLTALMIAVKCCDSISTSLLLEEKCDVNMKDYGLSRTRYAGYNALMIAATMGHTSILKQLIEAKANVNSKNKYNRSPLYMAVCGNHNENVSCLIDHKANVNHRDKGGNCLLIHSVVDNSVEISRLLINNGGYIHLPNKKKITPYHFVKLAPVISMELVGIIDKEQERLKKTWKSILYKILGGVVDKNLINYHILQYCIPA